MTVDAVPELELKDLCIAFAPTFNGFPVAADIRAAVEELAQQLKPLCAAVEEATLPALDFNRELLNAGELIGMAIGAFQPGEQERPTTLAQYLKALHRRDQSIIAWEQFFDEWDVLLCPPSMTTTFPHCETGSPLHVGGQKVEYWMVSAHGTLLQTFEISRAEVVRQLKRVGLEIRALQFLGAGDFTRAWVANNQIVVRFARHAQAEAALRREAELLPWLAKRLIFQIPQPEFHQAPTPATFGFVTYPIVAGTAMTRQRFLALTRSKRDQFGAHVAQFLHELHAVPLRLPRAHQLPTFTPRERYATLFAKAERIFLPQLTPALAQFLASTFRGYLDSTVYLSSHNVLLHGDLGPPHILCRNERSAAVTGVIDFGDMQIGPPAWDLVFLYEDFGVEFMQSFLAHFRTEHEESLLREMYSFYQFDMVACVVREIECKGVSRAKTATAHLERLRVRAGNEPWRILL